MWTYFFGPLLSLFPKPWRKILPFYEAVSWKHATISSAFAETACALMGLFQWYSNAMTRWTDHAVSSALQGNMGPGVTPQEIGSVALVVWASHPLTWVLGYFAFEGAVRLFAAAFSDGSPCTLPLFLVDKIILEPFRQDTQKISTQPITSSKSSSFTGSLLERMSPLVPDELCFSKDAAGEVLEIRSCRRKKDWNPPRIVRHEENYYRLESDALGSAPRPFRYMLRKLPVGVPGRSVLIYSPADAVILEPASASGRK